MVVVSPVGLPVKRAISSRLSTTSAVTPAGMVAAGSATTSMSQVWKACSLSRSPTNWSKPNVIGPIANVKPSRSCGVTGLDAGEQLRVGGQGVVALREGALGVPGVPHAWGEVVGGVPAGECVLQPALGDHRAGAQVREHLRDGPLRRVGAAGQLLLGHRCCQVPQALDGGPQRVEVRVSVQRGWRVVVAGSCAGWVMGQTLATSGECSPLK